MDKHDEIIEEIHRIRSEIMSEDEGLTSEERSAKMNKEGIRIAKKLGLKILKYEEIEADLIV